MRHKEFLIRLLNRLLAKFRSKITSKKRVLVGHFKNRAISIALTKKFLNRHSIRFKRLKLRETTTTTSWSNWNSACKRVDQSVNKPSPITNHFQECQQALSSNSQVARKTSLSNITIRDFRTIPIRVTLIRISIQDNNRLGKQLKAASSRLTLSCILKNSYMISYSKWEKRMQDQLTT